MKNIIDLAPGTKLEVRYKKASLNIIAFAGLIQVQVDVGSNLLVQLDKTDQCIEGMV